MSEVSVIIPTYNRENFISECVQSVLAQTMPAREIIVVDDGSTDATYNILSDFGFNSISTQKTVLRYFFQENRGVSAARNLGHVVHLMAKAAVTILEAAEAASSRH